MKPLLTVLILTLQAMAASFFTGCAATEGSAGEVGTKLEQGLMGRGQIVPNDPTSDSFGPEYQ